jgi:hypothetical protein
MCNVMEIISRITVIESICTYFLHRYFVMVGFAIQQ